LLVISLVAKLKSKVQVHSPQSRTLCAEEVCPVIVSKAKKIHWPFPDPAGHGGTDEQQLQRFRETRDAIAAKLKASISKSKEILPVLHV
jgi:protein-tyrosine-phosphatase